VPGNPRAFVGISPDGQHWNRISATVKEVKITSVPTLHLDGQQKGSAFLFQFGGLCLVHLGDLGQPLTPELRSLLGRPDVLLLPIGGGSYSIGPERARAVLQDLQPRLAIPMHPGEPEEEVISRFVAGFPRVQRLEQTALSLTQLSLPVQTTIAVLKHL